MAVRDIATLKFKLTDKQLRIVNYVAEKIENGVITENGTKAKDHVFIGVEPLISTFLNRDIEPWDFCEELYNYITGTGTQTTLAKATAYDLMLSNLNT